MVAARARGRAPGGGPGGRGRYTCDRANRGATPDAYPPGPRQRVGRTVLRRRDRADAQARAVAASAQRAGLGGPDGAAQLPPANCRGDHTALRLRGGATRPTRDRHWPTTGGPHLPGAGRDQSLVDRALPLRPGGVAVAFGNLRPPATTAPQAIAAGGARDKIKGLCLRHQLQRRARSHETQLRHCTAVASSISSFVRARPTERIATPQKSSAPPCSA